MRIVTWNCQMAFDKKADALLALNPDVAVIPECSEKSALSLNQRGYHSLWFGSNPHKGLGIFSREGWKLRALPSADQQWIVPIQVDAPVPFTLIAVWACRASGKKADRYIGQVHQALITHPEWFDGPPVILAGDLNSNAIWDHERLLGNHSHVVNLLDDHGLISSYHEFFGETQGAETRNTIYLYRHLHRPFHLDYVFIPRQWRTRLKKVAVGEHAQWSSLSDHCPVIVDIAP